MNFAKLSLACLLLTLLLPQNLHAQAGTSSMSVGISRARIARYGPGGQYRMPSPEMIRVEEYINYHRHQLPLPIKGERVRLDLQQMQLQNGKTVFQVGITTPRALAQNKIPPMNIVLVIDRSGSMSGDRIANVKKSIRAMIEQFRESDKVSIVGFSNEACVHLAPTRKTKLKKIQKALNKINAGGGTNLFSGLMLGYEQALKHYDAERTNRVIFLTDGNANIGTTETEQIAKKSKACNKRGISLSTIGLGHDFNHELLRELADKGKGVVHFVDDSKDIKKTFVSEIDSLLAPAANKVRLTLDFGKCFGTPKIYGYEPKQKDNGDYVFKLDDLNHGATQVIIARLPSKDAQPWVRATLSYKDAITGQQVELKKDSDDLDVHRIHPHTAYASEIDESGTDVDKRTIRRGGHPTRVLASINRNYAIALVANSIRTAAEASDAGDCEKAEQRLRKGIAKARSQCDDRSDKHVERIIDLAADYQQKIAACIARGQD